MEIPPLTKTAISLRPTPSNVHKRTNENIGGVTTLKWTFTRFPIAGIFLRRSYLHEPLPLHRRHQGDEGVAAVSVAMSRVSRRQFAIKQKINGFTFISNKIFCFKRGRTCRLARSSAGPTRSPPCRRTSAWRCRRGPPLRGARGARCSWARAEGPVPCRIRRNNKSAINRHILGARQDRSWGGDMKCPHLPSSQLGIFQE